MGVGMNMPDIIKLNFWRMTAKNQKAVYACANLGEIYVPKEIKERSIFCFCLESFQ